MPFVVKSKPYDLDAVRNGRSMIHEPIQNESFFGNGFIESYDEFFWFWAEQGEGNMLFARAQAGPIRKEPNDSGRLCVYFMPRVISEDVVSPITLDDFRSLDRKACGTPMEKLNQILYVQAHCKAAPIDQETYDFLLQRFN